MNNKNNELDIFEIADAKLKSRLFVGTGKFASNQIMKKVIEISETEVVTVSMRRVNFNKITENILDYINIEKIKIMPNTAGARDADDAIKLARLAKATGISNWIKLEVTPEPNYLLPDSIETLKAAEILVKEGFYVFPYIEPDPILAKRLEEVGCAAVMPLGSPIGSNQGLKSIEMLEIIIEQANVPVIIDAGIGAPSDAAKAMELGASAVLINTALATAKNPYKIAEAFKLAVIGGREGYLAGLPPKKKKAEPSSPIIDFL
ncbi:MAG TPA: thiazole synthase [bacterium]|nr:thiazole synthase [bacterium]HOL47021.1 thiazole synthase [bacterium]HPQ18477.1 thiazole synthase [bacterium]